MRITDWSSDVCSSDLCILGKFFEGSAPRNLILRIGQKIRHCLSRLLIGEDLYNLLTRRRQRLRWSGGDVGNTNNVPAERRLGDLRYAAPGCGETGFRYSVGALLRISIGNASWRERVCPDG